MIASRASLRGIGWAALLGLCCAALFGLSLKVNAVKAEVRQTENRILALRRETLYLETEYETRANQQQLAAWNAVDFGYQAPTAGQYFENERQLAALGKSAGPGAPTPIRVAAAPSESAALPAMVSPLTGKPLDEEDAVDVRGAGHGRRRHGTQIPCRGLVQVGGSNGSKGSRVPRVWFGWVRST